MVSVLGRLLAASAIALLFTIPVQAGDNDPVADHEELLKRVQKEHYPAYSGSTVEEAIAQFFKDGEIDEGTYPASEMTERGFDLRRTKPERVRYNGRLFFKYSSDDVSDLDKWERELELSLKYGDWDAFFRFSDVNTFAYADDPFRWEKGRLRYRHDDVKISLGSFGALFARGLALNMFEDRSLEFDNELEGVKAEYTWCDTELTALWGTRKERTQPRSAEVSAVRADFPLCENARVGAHVVNVRFPDSSYTVEQPNMLDYDLIGGDFTFREGPFKLVAEAVKLDRDQTEFGSAEWDQQGADGEGYYVLASVTGPGYALSGEYKDYQGLTHPFSVLPPLRRYNEQATADPNDEKGYAVELIWSPFRDGSLFTFSHAQDNIHEGGFSYTESGASYASPATCAVPWAGEYWKVNVHGEKHDIQRLTLNRQLNDRWTAGTFLERERLSPGFAEGYTDYIVEADLFYESVLGISYSRETTGMPAQEGEKTRWEIWELKIRPDDRQELNVAVGSRREGFVCAGGVCRIEPPFDGFRVDYLFRF